MAMGASSVPRDFDLGQAFRFLTLINALVWGLAEPIDTGLKLLGFKEKRLSG
jgi:hypothetical protein